MRCDVSAAVERVIRLRLSALAARTALAAAALFQETIHGRADNPPARPPLGGREPARETSDSMGGYCPGHRDRTDLPRPSGRRPTRARPPLRARGASLDGRRVS